ncbi:hypothetical protein GGI43DRAFT_221548 [Trichoderma evansii]
MRPAENCSALFLLTLQSLFDPGPGPPLFSSRLLSLVLLLFLMRQVETDAGADAGFVFQGVGRSDEARRRPKAKGDLEAERKRD